MNTKLHVMKIVNIVLLIVSCIALLFGLIYAGVSAGGRKHDADKISVAVTSVRTDAQTSGSSTTYYAYTNYHIVNGTGAVIYYISLKTYVYNSEGTQLGYLTTSIGADPASVGSASSDTKIAAGGTLDKEYYISSYKLTEGALFTEIYNLKTDLTYDCNVLAVYFSDGKKWTSD